MSEKIQEKINEIKKKRDKYTSQVRRLDLKSKRFFEQGPYLSYHKEIKKEVGFWKALSFKHDYDYFLEGKLMEIVKKETGFGFRYLLKYHLYNDSYYKYPTRYNGRIPEDLNHDDWIQFKKITDCIIKHQDELIEEIEVEKKKKELYRLTHCEKIYDHVSDCDTVCELCGNVVRIGEKCSCIEIEIK